MVFGYVFKIQAAVRSTPRLGIYILAFLWLSFKQFHRIIRSKYNFKVIKTNLKVCNQRSDHHSLLICRVVTHSRGWKQEPMAENIWSFLLRNIYARFSKFSHEHALMPLIYPYELEENFMVSVVFKSACAFHYKSNVLFEKSQR